MKLAQLRFNLMNKELKQNFTFVPTFLLNNPNLVVLNLKKSMLGDENIILLSKCFY
jgi:hypothetical protein